MQTIKTRTNESIPQTLSLGELAESTNATLHGDPHLKISGVGTISHAKAGEIAFVAESKYRKFIPTTAASAVILTANEVNAFHVKAALISPDPKLIFAKVVQLLYPMLSIEPMCHPSATIAKSAQIHPLTYIGPNCVIGERVKIGANVVLQAGCIIGDDCEIGEGTVLYPNVCIYHHCQVGQDCTIHSGAVIGSDGFGFAKNKDKWLKVGQIGRVKIGARVDIGANTTIDRGAIDDTEIGNDVILDNLIQIGHNVRIGCGTAIAACSGIAGSTVVGKHCLIGGGSRINGHITIADSVTIVGCTNVVKSIEKVGVYASATNENEIKVWKKNLARFHQLDELANRLITLKKKLEAKEEG